MSQRIGKSATQVTVRLDDEVLVRVEKIRKKLAKIGSPFEVEFGRSDALRAIIRRGLVVMEDSLDGK